MACTAQFGLENEPGPPARKCLSWVTQQRGNMIGFKHIESRPDGGAHPRAAMECPASLSLSET
jgi:hypothetical protein